MHDPLTASIMHRFLAASARNTKIKNDKVIRIKAEGSLLHNNSPLMLII